MLVVGNWKMNTGLDEAVRLASGVARAVADHAETVGVGVCPPFVWLEAVREMIEGSAVRLGAQTMATADSGAFTGEISASMLTDLGCRYVILGHSERRQLFGETDAAVGEKVVQARRHGLIPIVCVGETEGEREAGEAEAVVERQLKAALAQLPDLESAEDLVIAYEPVWAIGTGKTASPDDAQAMHQRIRLGLVGRYPERGRDVHILYGGSVKPGNAAELFAQPDINGGLIGGASLDEEAFAAIVEAGASR